MDNHKEKMDVDTLKSYIHAREELLRDEIHAANQAWLESQRHIQCEKREIEALYTRLAALHSPQQ